jgi:hypothetical protein
MGFARSLFSVQLMESHSQIGVGSRFSYNFHVWRIQKTCGHRPTTKTASRWYPLRNNPDFRRKPLEFSHLAIWTGDLREDAHYRANQMKEPHGQHYFSGLTMGNDACDEKGHTNNSKLDFARNQSNYRTIRYWSDRRTEGHTHGGSLHGGSLHGGSAADRTTEVWQASGYDLMSENQCSFIEKGPNHRVFD